MFKDLTHFFKSKNGKWILLIIIVLFVIWALMSYSSSKGMVMDNMDNYGSTGRKQMGGPPQMVNAAPPNLLESSELSNAAQGPMSNGYALQQVANPADLLPQDTNSQWTALNPTIMNNSGAPIPPDMLQAANLIGLDTIGQTLKNANLQLRSDPVIVKQNVGPWNNSTYEADLGRVPLELGCGPQ